MKRKIYFLLNIFVVSCASDPLHETTIPYYKDSKSLYEETKNRPDLMSLAYMHNPHLWASDPKITLYFSESLQKTGKYKQSNALALGLLFEKLHYFHRGRLYLILAENYQALKLHKNARFYYEKTIRYKNYYYLYRYARFESDQQDLMKSIELHRQALSLREKDYIVSSFHRVLEKALICYRDTDHFEEIKQIALEANFDSKRLHIIKNPFTVSGEKCTRDSFSNQE